MYYSSCLWIFLNDLLSLKNLVYTFFSLLLTGRLVAYQGAGYDFFKPLYRMVPFNNLLMFNKLSDI